MDNSRLLFRPALPGDTGRILQIIRQAQAQMRALGSAQWQDGYPSAEHIADDIARGWGRVLCPPERAGACGKTGVSEEALACGEIGVLAEARTFRELEKSRTGTQQAPGLREQEVPKAVACGEARAAAAYGAVVFDGEPAYDGIEGAWLTDGPYVVLHRLAVADGWKRRGVAREFMLRTEELAREQGVCGFRIDTNFDNRYMLRLLEGQGFVYCGKIRYASGERLAFEKRL